MTDAFNLSPEDQASLDAYRAKLAASTTTLDVTPAEYLDVLKTLSTDELIELQYDAAFREWKLHLEYTRDAELFGQVVAFITAKPNLKSLEEELWVLRSLSRNRFLTTANIEVLLNLSSVLKFGYEEWLAGCLNLSEAQALRLAKNADAWDLYYLAHNSELSAEALAAVADRLITLAADPDTDDETQERITRTKAEVLINPACTSEVRERLNPDADLLALAAEVAAQAQREAELEDKFDEDFEDN